MAARQDGRRELRGEEKEVRIWGTIEEWNGKVGRGIFTPKHDAESQLQVHT